MPTVRILQGHVLDTLRQLPNQSVHCCITSPPYWGLRSYQTEPQIWGGTDECEHVWGADMPKPGSEYREGLSTSIFAGREDKGEIRESFTKARGEFALDPKTIQAGNKGSLSAHRGGSFCQPCGAWRGELGSEPTPELYVEHLVQVFREVWRTLRSDGVIFVNMGDSYAANGISGLSEKGHSSTLQGGANVGHSKQKKSVPPGLKPKDLCGMPWRLAFALQADGWWLRSDIIWAKPNPMPESCTDRPTKGHEYVFLMAKSGSNKFWTHRDLSGVRSQPDSDYRWQHADGHEVVEAPPEWLADPDIRVKCPTCGGSGKVRMEKDTALFGTIKSGWVECGRCAESWQVDSGVKHGTVLRWERINLWDGHDYYYDAEAVKEPLKQSSIKRLTQDTFDQQTGGPKDYGHRTNANRSARKALCNLKEKLVAEEKWGDRHCGWADRSKSIGRNLRTVWTIPTEGNPLAHFATFPRRLVEPCILAGTSEKGVCPACGAPWARVVERKPMEIQRSGRGAALGEKGRTAASGTMTAPPESKTTAWRPTCSCPATDPVPATVLDPFSGTGTTGIVAIMHGRAYVGLELNSEYVKMSLNRIRADCGMLATMKGAPNV